MICDVFEMIVFELLGNFELVEDVVGMFIFFFDGVFVLLCEIVSIWCDYEDLLQVCMYVNGECVFVFVILLCGGGNILEFGLKVQEMVECFEQGLLIGVEFEVVFD